MKSGKFLLFALLVLLLCFIWGNSLLPASLSSDFSGWVRDIVNRIAGSVGADGLQGVGRLRKMAHFAEFTALGAVTMSILALRLRRAYRGAAKRYGEKAEMAAEASAPGGKNADRADRVDRVDRVESADTADGGGQIFLQRSDTSRAAGEITEKQGTGSGKSRAERAEGRTLKAVTCAWNGRESTAGFLRENRLPAERRSKRVFFRLLGSILAAAGFGFAVACADEAIQLTSDGRSAQFSDVLLDFAGFAAGMLLAFAVLQLKRALGRKG